MKRQAAREAQESEAKGYLPRGGLHPPAFPTLPATLGLASVSPRMRCGACGSTVLFPTKLLAERQGNKTLGRAKCGRCGKPPESVYMCAGHRTRHGGPPADWAIELLSPPR